MSTQPKLSNVSIDQLVEAPSNYRKVYPKAEMEELTESIRKNGIISPILVREIKKGKYEVVAGSRRFRAGTAAELKEFPVVIRELTDNQVLEIQLIENVQRQDPHPMEEAQAFKQAIELLKYSVQELALRVSKSDSYVQQRLKLNDLIEEFQNMLFENEIQLSHAIQLCRLTEEDQNSCILNITDGWGDNRHIKSAASLKTYIQNNITLHLDSSPFDKEDVNLNPEAGSCITCAKRSGFNTNLFNDIEEKDRCFDKGCFEVKLNSHVDKQEADLKASGDLFYICSTSTNPPDYIKKKYPNLIVSWNHFKKIDSKKESCKSASKGLVVYGNGDQGEVIKICTDKKCTKHWYYNASSSSTKNSDPVQAAKARIERARELDGEKVQEKISEALLNDPGLATTDQKMNKSEVVGMMMLVFENATHDIKRKIFSHLKWAKSISYSTDTMDIFLKKIKTSTMEERAYIVRMILVDTYKSVLNAENAGAVILRELAIEKGLPVDKIEADQAEIRAKREEKANVRLKELQLEAKKEKEASGKKAKKGVSA